MHLTQCSRKLLLAALFLALGLGACGRQQENKAHISSPTPAEESKAKADDASVMEKLVAAQKPARPAPMARMSISERAVAAPGAPESAETGTSASKEAQLTSGATTYVDGERKFIRTASAVFMVKDVYASALAIEDAVATHGGFVVNNSIFSQTLRSQRVPKGDGTLTELTEYEVSGTLVVRIPSAKTQEFLRAIANQIEFLQQRNFDARDVQFDLLRQHLERIRQQETQADLGQAVRDGGRLYDKSEVISQRNSAKAARDEAIIARKQLEDQIAFSSIRFSLQQGSRIRQTVSTDLNAVFASHRPDFSARLGNSLAHGWNGLLDLFVGLMRLWPLWIILIVSIVLIKRALCKRRQARGQSKPETHSEAART